MTKNLSLRAFLDQQSGNVELGFDELENLIPGGLPKSAYLYEAWWNNDDPTAHQSDAWGDAGYILG